MANLTAEATSQAVVVEPYNQPSLSVQILADNCSLPATATGDVACPVLIQNTGNVRLHTVFVNGSGRAVMLGCRFSELWPGSVAICQVHKQVSQMDFDTADINTDSVIDLAIEGTADPRGVNQSALLVSEAQLLQLQPVLRRNLTINTEVNTTSVTSAGKTHMAAAHLPTAWLGVVAVCAAWSVGCGQDHAYLLLD